MIPRLIKNKVSENFFRGKTIIIYGARQVGKTTFVQQLLKEFGEKGRYLNCEIISIEQNLKDAEPEKLKSFLGDYKLIVLDEAQNIPGIGRILKVITDTLAGIQVIATGSSGFDIAYKTAEPMTGRVVHYTMYPLSVTEIKNATDWLTVESQLEKLLIFGSYPEVYLSDNEKSIERLGELSSGYLFKDLLKFEGIKKSSLLKDLIVLLSLQLGNPVSYNELATQLGVNAITVRKYIDLLEQCFVIFRLNSFSRNLRNELSKSFKVYFFDNGIRNSLINNFNPLSLRGDIGALWENFCVSERIKSTSIAGRNINRYFWRTYDQKEIDYVEEENGKITGYEIKYSEKGKFKIPVQFAETYNAEVKKIDRSNYWKFFEMDI